MIRFEEVNEKVLQLVKEVGDANFPELRNVKIKFLFDTKKRTHGGKIVLGFCQKTNDLVKHLTIEQAYDEDGYQYVISFDKVTWDNTEDKDRVRLIRHELRHISVDEDARQPYRIYPHDLEDFSAECILNADDPDWARRVGSLTAEIYSQKEDQEGEAAE